MIKDGAIVKNAIVKKRPLPDWYINEPVVHTGDYFFMQAYVELRSCADQKVIPWDKIITYASFNNLSKTMARALVTIIRCIEKVINDEEAEK